MKIKVLPLLGFESLRALNAFQTLMLGLKMLPEYQGEGYEEFYARIEALPEDGQEKLIREAVLFVPLEREEVEALIRFTCDANGIPYRKENSAELGPGELHELIVAVCKEIAKIKIDFVSKTEKKN